MGGECDALAVRPDGALLAIEIKPSSADTIPWVPVQVLHYRNVIAAWAEQCPSHAVEIINGTLEQRRILGLAAAGGPQCKEPIKVVPVIAIQRGVSDIQLDRLRVVYERVRRAAVRGADPLEVHLVNPALRGQVGGAASH